MRCEKICKNLKKMILEESFIHGYIHSIFSSAINIIADNGTLISIIKSEKGIGPYSITIDCEENFLNIPIKIKEEVVISLEMLRFKNFHINLNTDIPIDLSIDTLKAKSTNENFVILDKKTKDLKQYILINGNTQGILSILSNIEKGIKYDDDYEIVNSTYGILIPKINRFTRALKDRTYDDLSIITRDVVGFGIGLTPSSDDFLCGIMASLLYGSKFTNYNYEYFLDIFAQMIQKIENKTTLISEKFLLNSSLGMYPLFMKELCEYIFWEETYEKVKLRKLLQNTLKFGATSGTDILCGIYIGTNIIKDYFGGLGYE